MKAREASNPKIARQVQRSLGSLRVDAWNLRRVNGGIHHQTPNTFGEIAALFGSRTSSVQRRLFRLPQISFHRSGIGAGGENAENCDGVRLCVSTSIWRLVFTSWIPFRAQLCGDARDELWITGRSSIIAKKTHSET
jgi:hypothetical protein